MEPAPSRIWLGRPGVTSQWELIPDGELPHAIQGGWEVREYAQAGSGTPEGRMRAVWDWIHEDGAGREKVLEELCPGWSILSSRIASEQALMIAFDNLVAERAPKREVMTAGRFVLVDSVDGEDGYVTSWDTWDECFVAFEAGIMPDGYRLEDGETGRVWHSGSRYEWEAAQT